MTIQQQRRHIFGNKGDERRAMTVEIWFPLPPTVSIFQLHYFSSKHTSESASQSRPMASRHVYTPLATQILVNSLFRAESTQEEAYHWREHAHVQHTSASLMVRRVHRGKHTEHAPGRSAFNSLSSRNTNRMHRSTARFDTSSHAPLWCSLCHMQS